MLNSSEARNNKPKPETIRHSSEIISDKKIKRGGFVSFAESFIKIYKLLLLLVIAAALCVFVAASFLLYRTDIEDIKSRIVQKQAVLAEKEQELGRAKSIKIDFDNIGESSKKIIDILPLEKDLPGIFVQLEALAIKNNLFLGSLDIAAGENLEEKEGVAARQLNKLILTLNVKGGDYFTFKNYLADIENNLRLLDIKSIAYTPDSNVYSLTLNTYYFGEQYEEPEPEE